MTSQVSSEKPEWTPDGRHIVYLRDHEGKLELGPRISPDGRWLTYISDESGQYEVYVRPFRRPGARVQISANGGTEPLWTANGSRIIYRSADRFIAATLATSTGISVTTRQELFEDRYLSGFTHPQYDVDRTGKTFVLLHPVGTAEIIVVVNGLSKILSAASGGH